MSSSKGFLFHRVEAAGIEPAGETDASDSVTNSCENQEPSCAALALQNGDCNCLNSASIDADLRELLDSWDCLPVTAKTAVLAIVRSFIQTPKLTKKGIPNSEPALGILLAAVRPNGATCCQRVTP